jgi:hypothetical protein
VFAPSACLSRAVPVHLGGSGIVVDVLWSAVVVVYLVNLKVPNTLSKSVKHKSKVHGIDAKRLPPRQQ